MRGQEITAARPAAGPGHSAARPWILLIALFLVANTLLEVAQLVRAAAGPLLRVTPERTVAVAGGFGSDVSMAVGADGRIYTAQAAPPRLRVFDATGALLATWDGQGGTPRLQAPADVALLPDGRLAVLDMGAAAIVRCTTEGRGCSTLRVSGLNAPRGLWPRRGGGFYVADTGNSRVVRVDEAGRIQAAFGGAGPGGYNEPGQFLAPWSLAEGDQGQLYVADFGDHGNGRIQELSPSGAYIREWDTDGPVSRLALAGGVLYALLPDYGGAEAVLLGSGGLAWVSASGRPAPLLPRPAGLAGLAVSPRGTLLLADRAGLVEYALPAGGAGRMPFRGNRAV